MTLSSSQDALPQSQEALPESKEPLESTSHPRKRSKKKKKKFLLASSNIFSQFFFFWVIKLVYLVQNAKDLKSIHLNLFETETSAYTGDLLKNAWDQQVQKGYFLQDSR